MAKQKSMMEHMKSRNSMQLNGGGPDDPPKGKKKAKLKPSQKPSETKDYTYNFNREKEKKDKADGMYDMSAALVKKQDEFKKYYTSGKMPYKQVRDSMETTLDPNRFKTKKELTKAADRKMKEKGMKPAISYAIQELGRTLKKGRKSAGQALETVVHKVTTKQMQGCPPKGGQNSGGKKSCK